MLKKKIIKFNKHVSSFKSLKLNMQEILNLLYKVFGNFFWSDGKARKLTRNLGARPSRPGSGTTFPTVMQPWSQKLPGRGF
jgi:hypothetical protein